MEISYKAVAFDIDGTLTDAASGQIVASAVAAINQAQMQGVKFIIDSGRPRCAMQQLAAAGLKPDIVAACNGHVIYNLDGYVAEQRKIPLDPYRDISDYCTAHEIGLFWKFLEGIFVQVDNPADPWHFADETEVYYRCQPDPTRSPNGGCLRATPEQVEAFMRHFRTKVDVIPSMDGEYDIGMRGVNKKTGLQAVLGILGIEPEACIAFGDAESDLEMLEYAGVGIAMGNAPAAVKQAADTVTDVAAKDGVAMAMKKYGLIGIAAAAAAPEAAENH